MIRIINVEYIYVPDINGMGVVVGEDILQYCIVTFDIGTIKNCNVEINTRAWLDKEDIEEYIYKTLNKNNIKDMHINDEESCKDMVCYSYSLEDLIKILKDR